MKLKCSIIVLSCDKNIGPLKLFMKFFNENWRSCSYPVYVGLEKIMTNFEGAEVINSEEALWGKRIKNYLQNIETEYVLIFLDDFLIEKPVDDKIIESYINILDENPDIATISLADIYDKGNKETEFNSLVERKHNGNYLLNLQVGIWRKSLLINLLMDKESPWQTELYGSIRARKLRNCRFLCLNSDSNMPIQYNRGWLIVRGSWNADEIVRLNLQEYTDCIFDGKDIIYMGYGFIKTDILIRIKRRIAIVIRQLLSWLKIYI